MSIADSSRRVYNHGQNCYLSLCNQLRIPPYPLIERNLTLFTTFLARSTGFSTIRTYLAAVRFRNIELGFSTNFEHMHQLNMILRGIKRLKGASCRPKRLPITPEIMRILKTRLRSSDYALQDQSMLWSAFTTAFFGFLRSSEFCCLSKHSFNRNSTLLLKDVSFVDDAVLIQIKVSKADPFRDGKQVRLAASGNSICPLRALKNHVRFCKDQDKPLFVFQNAEFLTRPQFTSIIRSLLGRDFPNLEQYSSHSFRIGAATTAAAAELPDWLIKDLGRWSSNCFEQYIRTPRAIVDSVPLRLSGVKSNRF